MLRAAKGRPSPTTIKRLCLRHTAGSRRSSGADLNPEEDRLTGRILERGRHAADLRRYFDPSSVDLPLGPIFDKVYD